MLEPIVQLSLDLTSIEEALHVAEIAVRAGVDWLEAGTPLILAEGLRAVRALRERFPQHPIVADLKTMDGGYLEAEMMAKAGASHGGGDGRGPPGDHPGLVRAARDYGIKVMGDIMAAPDKVACARMLEAGWTTSSCIPASTSVTRSPGLAPWNDLPAVTAAVTSRCRRWAA